MKRSILVVDDDAANRLTMVALLEDEGFVVFDADSGAAALAACERPYDLVLLDRHLGDCEASQILGRMRAQLPGARIVLISGDLEGMSGGFDGAIEKGTRFDEVLALIARLLG